LEPDVFVTVGTPATTAAKNVAGGRPIVFLSVTDPVGAGFVGNLARPNGNITGFTNIAAVLAGKRLELLKEMFPKLSRVAVLWEPENPGSIPQWKDSERPARELGLQLHSMGIGRADQLDRAFADLPKTGNNAVVVTLTPLTATNQQRIARIAIKEHAPAMCPDRTFASAGCLMSYGPTFAAVGRDVARHVDKILKGAKLADLPVEQPTTFELVINLKTARALGVMIPPRVMSRADQVLD
jgi:putative ABC transport system substrate-binding protein